MADPILTLAELERSGHIYRVLGKGTLVREAPLFRPEPTRLTSRHLTDST